MRSVLHNPNYYHPPKKAPVFTDTPAQRAAEFGGNLDFDHEDAGPRVLTYADVKKRLLARSVRRRVS